MKILIIKFAALGDAVTASCMLPPLRGKYPEAKITWLCGKEIYSLVETFEGVDDIVCVDNSLLAGNGISKVRFVVDIWRKFLGKSFDLILNAHTNKLYSLVTLGIKGKVKRALSGYFHFVPGRYHGNEYVRLALGAAYLQENYPVAESKLKYPQKVNRILMLPGGARNVMGDSALRRWPVGNYRILAELLVSKGFQVGLIGSKTDLWVEEHFCGCDVESFVGKTSIQELIKLIAGSVLLITHDSGPLYLAVYTDTPALSFFGPLMARDRLYGKYLEMSFSPSIPCSPCYDGKAYARCENNRCLQEISPEMVIDKLKKYGFL